MSFLRKKVKFYYFILLTSLFITFAYNLKFLKILYGNIGFSSFPSIYFFFAIIIAIISSISILLLIFGQKYVLKPLAIFLIILSSILSFYNHQFGVTVDEQMIINTLQTDIQEAMDLMSVGFFIHIFFLGIIPSIIIFFIEIEYGSFKKDLLIRLSFIVTAFLIVAVITFANFKQVSFITRQHKKLNQHITPLYTLNSAYRLVRSSFQETVEFKKLGEDAKLLENNKKTIGIMVVGETARADRFSLNGYQKETNPELKKRDVFSFNNTISCGTSTAYSVPCMFFLNGEKNFTLFKARNQSNVLDVLSFAGVNTIWVNNNSSCKYVCSRIKSIDVIKNLGGEDKNINFDEILLDTTNKILKDNKDNILIVLHTMGSHGPRYYKRFPDKFAKFKPFCNNNTPQNCSKNELNNAYDNTIVYTDYILSKLIDILKENKDYNSFMLYASDHGESLGENGIYLHGLPKKIAPKEQTNFAMVLWISDQMIKNQNINLSMIKNKFTKELNHDYLSHTLLNLFKVQTSIYKKNLSLLN
ncbi:MAG: phosphoethanolamine--lipid A transferase [Proteobacteria bacterium]|nr:phosphoethanolamine--lipid A transferase [Candidatus Fonsibacter sp. PEL5]